MLGWTVSERRGWEPEENKNKSVLTTRWKQAEGREPETGSETEQLHGMLSSERMWRDGAGPCWAARLCTFVILQVCGFPKWRSGKEPACQYWRHKRCGFDHWVWKIPWRRKWQPYPVFLPGESRGQRSLMGYSPRIAKELAVTEHAHTRVCERRCGSCHSTIISELCEVFFHFISSPTSLGLLFSPLLQLD